MRLSASARSSRSEPSRSWLSCWASHGNDTAALDAAISLSTFVMIGQNRQAAFQQAKADQDYADVSHLLVENTNLTRQIHELTAELHAHVIGDSPEPGD